MIACADEVRSTENGKRLKRLFSHRLGDLDALLLSPHSRLSRSTFTSKSVLENSLSHGTGIGKVRKVFINSSATLVWS